VLRKQAVTAGKPVVWGLPADAEFPAWEAPAGQPNLIDFSVKKSCPGSYSPQCQAALVTPAARYRNRNHGHIDRPFRACPGRFAGAAAWPGAAYLSAGKKI